MSTIIGPERKWNAGELRRLPAAERDRILADAAALAETLYQSDYAHEFEAFSKDDLHGESSGASES